MADDKYGIGDDLSESPLVGKKEKAVQEEAPQQKDTSQPKSDTVEINEILKAGDTEAKNVSSSESIEEDGSRKEKRLTLIGIAVILLLFLLGVGYFAWATYQDMLVEQRVETSGALKNTETERELPDGNVAIEETVGVDGLKESSTFGDLSNEKTKTNKSVALSKSNSRIVKQGKLENGESKKERANLDSVREEAAKYPVRDESETQETPKSNLPKEYNYTKKNISVSKEKSMTPQEKEIMGLTSPIKKTTGGVCNLSVKYKLNLEYIPYTKVGGVYAPIFKTKDWDKKGIKFTRRIVVLGHDKTNKFTEVEEGIFFPSEMFSECSFYEKKENN